jgi:hypothetical protein
MSASGVLLGYPTFYYVEVVLPAERIPYERVWGLKGSGQETRGLHVGKDRVRILIFGSSMWDGQKTIWKEQMIRLSKEKFHFTYAINFAGTREGATVSKLLRELTHVRTVETEPFAIDPANFVVRHSANTGCRQHDVSGRKLRLMDRR